MAGEPGASGGGSPPDGTRWLLLVATLTTEDALGRMRVLRTLQTLGAAVLRDGVYLLPDTPAARRGLDQLSDRIGRQGGVARVLQASPANPREAGGLRDLFDRSARYDELIKTARSLATGFGIAEPGAMAKILARLRVELEAVRALDFFPSARREEAERTLTEMEARVRVLLQAKGASDEAPAAPIALEYFRRAWATRRPLTADRLACAWLVRRFIDPEAVMVWLDRGEALPASVVSFGFDGAAFGASSGRVAYEQMLDHFRLSAELPLARIARLIHALDRGTPGVPEAPGVETLLAGARRRASSDDELLAESEKAFDLLYDAYFDLPG